MKKWPNERKREDMKKLVQSPFKGAASTRLLHLCHLVRFFNIFSCYFWFFLFSFSHFFFVVLYCSYSSLLCMRAIGSFLWLIWRIARLCSWVLCLVETLISIEKWRPSLWVNFFWVVIVIIILSCFLLLLFHFSKVANFKKAWLNLLWSK